MRERKRASGALLAILLAIGLAVGLSLAPARPALAAVPEVEPNGTLATAQPVVPAQTLLTTAFPPPGSGALVTGSVAPGDVDYFAFDLAAGQLLTVAVVTDDEGALADPVVGLFDPTGALVATDDDSGPGFLPALRLVVPTAGTWKVAVSGFGDVHFDGSIHSETFSYRLVLSAAPPASTEPSPDHNGSFATADALPVGGGAFDAVAPGGVTVVTGNITAGDVDYWTVPVPPGRTLTAALYDADGGALADPVLRVLSSSDTSLRNDDDSGPGFLPEVASLTAPTGSPTLTLAVSGFGDATFDGSHDESFGYQLVVALGPSGAMVCDVNGDHYVDSTDINAIFAARGQPASGSTDPRDADRDGQITVLDGRACTLQCGSPNCAPKPAASCGLVGLEALAPVLLLTWRRRRLRAAAKGDTR